MEVSTVEVIAVEKAVEDVGRAQMQQLIELQLVLSGGGIGEVFFG
jgi:hypothetical protein